MLITSPFNLPVYFLHKLDEFSHWLSFIFLLLSCKSSSYILKASFCQIWIAVFSSLFNSCWHCGRGVFPLWKQGRPNLQSPELFPLTFFVTWGKGAIATGADTWGSEPLAYVACLLTLSSSCSASNAPFSSYNGLFLSLTSLMNWWFRQYLIYDGQVWLHHPLVIGARHVLLCNRIIL